jgi:hypothetical protein
LAVGGSQSGKERKVDWQICDSRRISWYKVQYMQDVKMEAEQGWLGVNAHARKPFD